MLGLVWARECLPQLLGVGSYLGCCRLNTRTEKQANQLEVKHLCLLLFVRREMLRRWLLQLALSGIHDQFCLLMEAHQQQQRQTKHKAKM